VSAAARKAIASAMKALQRADKVLRPVARGAVEINQNGAPGALYHVKGGKARAAKLSPERRREIAKAAAAARWAKKEQSK